MGIWIYSFAFFVIVFWIFFQEIAYWPLGNPLAQAWLRRCRLVEVKTRQEFFVFHGGEFQGKTSNSSKRGAASSVAWRKGLRQKWQIANFIEEAEVYGVEEKIPAHLFKNIRVGAVAGKEATQEEGKQLVLVGIL